MSVSFFILAVPDGKGHGLHAAGDQEGFIFRVIPVFGQRTLHHHSPEPFVPFGFTFDLALPGLARQCAEPAADEIFDGRGTSRDYFELANPPLLASAFLGPGFPAIHVALPISFPMPDVDVVIQLAHTKKRRRIPQGKGQRRAVTKHSRSQPFVFGRILPFHQEGDVFAVVNRPHRDDLGAGFGPNRPCDDLTAQGNGNGRDGLPRRVIGLRGQRTVRKMGPDHDPLRTHRGDPEPTKRHGQAHNARSYQDQRTGKSSFRFHGTASIA